MWRLSADLTSATNGTASVNGLIIGHVKYVFERRLHDSMIRQSVRHRTHLTNGTFWVVAGAALIVIVIATAWAICHRTPHSPTARTDRNDGRKSAPQSCSTRPFQRRDLNLDIRLVVSDCAAGSSVRPVDTSID
jgi:hypothetical protein